MEDEFETWLYGTLAEAFSLTKSFDPAPLSLQNSADKEDPLGQSQVTIKTAPLLL